MDPAVWVDPVGQEWTRYADGLYRSPGWSSAIAGWPWPMLVHHRAPLTRKTVTDT